MRAGDCWAARIPGDAGRCGAPRTNAASRAVSLGPRSRCACWTSVGSDAPRRTILVLARGLSTVGSVASAGTVAATALLVPRSARCVPSSAAAGAVGASTAPLRAECSRESETSATPLRADCSRDRVCVLCMWRSCPVVERPSSAPESRSRAAATPPGGVRNELPELGRRLVPLRSLPSPARLELSGVWPPGARPPEAVGARRTWPLPLLSAAAEALAMASQGTCLSALTHHVSMSPAGRHAKASVERAIVPWRTRRVLRMASCAAHLGCAASPGRARRAAGPRRRAPPQRAARPRRSTPGRTPAGWCSAGGCTC